MSVKHTFEMAYFFEDHGLDEELTVPDFENIVEPIIEKAVSVAETALTKAAIDKDDLNGILLAGGTSQVPLVKSIIEDRLDCSAMVAANDLMWLIAKGAAIHHRDLMTRPKEATKLYLGADLYLETFTHGRLTETVLVPSHQVLPHTFSREFPINPNNSLLTIQLLTESGTHQNGLLRLDRRQINTSGLGINKIGVKVAIDKNKTIKLNVTDPKTGVQLDNVEVRGDALSTPEEIRSAREHYGFIEMPATSTSGHQRYAVGIDLGTTTCEAIVWDLADKTFQHGIEEPLLSQVLIRESGAVSVDNGDHNPEMQGFFSNFKVDIGGESQQHKYVAHGKQWPPEIFSAHLLAAIWRQLQIKYGATAPLTEAVITVPSDFSEDQAALVQNAAKIAGIRNPILLSEPVAAFLAYADTYSLNRRVGQKFLIFDFGGGTTDVCIIETKPGDQVDTLKSNGNNSIGGKDVTYLIADTIIDRFATKNHLALTNADRDLLRKRLFKKADKAKIELSMALMVGSA